MASQIKTLTEKRAVSAELLMYAVIDPERPAFALSFYTLDP